MLVGLLPLLGRVGRIAGTGIALPLLGGIWLVGQIYSGQATDPNTAVPLVVLALGVLSVATALPARRGTAGHGGAQSQAAAVPADRLAA